MVNSSLVQQTILVVLVLPVDHSFPKDLDALLIVGEARVLLGHLLYHVIQVLVLR